MARREAWGTLLISAKTRTVGSRLGRAQFCARSIVRERFRASGLFNLIFRLGRKGNRACARTRLRK